MSLSHGWTRLMRVWRRSPDADVDAEVRFHLEARVDDLLTRGRSPAEARAQALREFGNVDAVRAGLRAIDHRMVHRGRRAEWWEGLFQDLRHAGRGLRHAPGFAALVIATLALGIGATTAIFSVVNPILFEPMPFPHSGRVMTVWESDQGGSRDRVGFATYKDVARAVPALTDAAAMSYGSATLTGSGDPEPLVGQHVSWTFFRALGVHPVLGREFAQAEDRPGAPRVVIIGNGLWRRRFGSDSSIIGRPITLDGNSWTVVGVMGADFASVFQVDAQFWTPLRYDVSLPYACRSCHHLRVVARLRDGATLAEAARQLAVLGANLRRQFPTEYSPGSMAVVSLREIITGDVRPVLLAVLGGVAFVLLIACVNVTNLLLAQGVRRRGEFAVRRAMGAGTGRLLRQLATESLLVSCIGGALGVGLAALGVRALVAFSPPGLPLVDRIAVNGPVLAFAVVLTAVVALACAIAPAVHGARSDIHDDLRSSGRRTTVGGRRTRSALVTSEVALALVLLVGSGLLMRSLSRLFAVSPGFEPANAVTMQVQTGGPAYQTKDAVSLYFDRVLQAVRAVPGVESAGLTSQLPLSGDFDGYGIHSQSHPRPNPEEDPSAFRYAVSDGYFEAMHIPVRRGRALGPGDRAGQPPVALIGESFAAKNWPGEDPLGQHIRIGGAEDGPWYTIVGIVGDVKQQALSAGPANDVYVPEAQWPFTDPTMSLVVRTKVAPGAMATTLRAAIRAIDKDQVVTRVATMDALVAQTAAQRRFILGLFELFALVALILAAAGIYGVLSGTVSERLREIGVRAALGATGGDIVRLVIGQGLRLTAVGAALGLVAALGLSRLIASLLFDTSRIDPVTYAGTTAVLVAVALVACWIPAVRAARVDPMETLRAE
jgi:putative ABC transport system permease protein